MNLLFAVDHLYDAVVNDLASRYCPPDRAIFLGRLAALIAVVTVVALLLLLSARLGKQNARRKDVLYIGACAIGAFAAGSAVLVIFGLSGCTGGSQAGLTWEWPW